MKNAGNYAKSLVPLLITALYSTQSALSDGRVTNTEWAGIATGLLASLGAYIVPNTKAPAVTTSKFVAMTAPSNVNATPVTTTEPAPPVL